MKSAKNFIGFIIVMIVAVAILLAYKIYVPYNIGEKTVSITVDKQDSFATVLTQFIEKDILHDARLFRMMAVVTGLDKTVSPGRYDFSGRISLKSIAEKLRKKEIATFMVTIPEGLPIWETAAVIAKQTDYDSATFYSRITDLSYTKGNFELEGLEGYLFPETYRFWYQIELDEIIEILVDEYNRQTKDVDFDSGPNNLSEKEIIVLASIIEAEAQDGSELRTISSVYNNRLTKRMRLQADPTVIYAKGGMTRPLWTRDLEYDSPYNTYRNYGLPPGPINSPGLAAIKAALNPETTDFLYFVADGTGKHIFSKTLREHNRARNRIKKSNGK
ncbi:MAG: endolytic transglycosylase MltG [candidate division Zixibacteria bacterium]|nr:endolytic transglycosylase MltG [candidate division Zixibacteria bacterium]